MKKLHLMTVAISCILATTYFSCKRDEAIKAPQTLSTSVPSDLSFPSPTVSYAISAQAGTISDHADATQRGSIAWYLATYGGGTAASPITYYLSSDTVYNAKKQITVPAYGRITESTGVQAVIQCHPTAWNTAYDKLIRLNTASYLLHIELRLNFMAGIGIFADSANGIQLIDLTVSKSKRSGAATVTNPSPQSHLIYIANSSTVLINGCLLRRAGCDTGENPIDGFGYPIHIINGDHITITNNDIGICASSGIGFVATTFVTIQNNHINDTGRSTISSDGITSYHGNTGTINRVVSITYNTITNSHNHGIHVSGHGFDISNNTISNSQHSNIYIGDQRLCEDGYTDCSGDVWIQNNSLGASLDGPGRYSIYRDKVESNGSTIHIAGNTGYTTVQPVVPCAGPCNP
ncbi:MAG: right-handed parallel beta-helix repeat-containing protein [Bacteroidota bacterium]